MTPATAEGRGWRAGGGTALGTAPERRSSVSERERQRARPRAGSCWRMSWRGASQRTGASSASSMAARGCAKR